MPPQRFVSKQQTQSILWLRYDVRLLDALLLTRVGGYSPDARSAERGGAVSMEQRGILVLDVATSIWLESSSTV